MGHQRAAQLVEAGLWLRLSGDHDGARKLFEQALKLDPSNARARQLLDALQPKPAAAAPAPMPVAPVVPPIAPLEPLPRPPSTAWESNKAEPGVQLPATPQAGAALDLVIEEEPPPEAPLPDAHAKELESLLGGAKDLIELDDHSGALELLLKAQELSPGHPDVKRLKARSEGTLQRMYESKLGDLGRTPRVQLKDDEIIWLNLDHRAGFVLAQIDGLSTFEDIFSVSGMSRLDTARILAQLLDEQVIAPT